MQGYGNIHSQQQAVGTYTRSFDIPENWNDSELFFHMANIKDAVSIWVNGDFIGYAKGHGPAEFRITDSVTIGENTIVLSVLKFGKFGSSTPDWSLSGIDGSAYVYATPRAHIRDIAIASDYNAERAEVSIATSLRNLDTTAHTRSLRIQLFDSEGGAILAQPLTRAFVIDARAETTLKATVTIPEPSPWTAETPHRYRAVVTLLSSDNHASDIRAIDFGVRDIDIHDGQLRVNRQPIAICGIEWQPHSPHSGRALTRNEMALDVALMKQANINAIYLSGGRPEPYLLDLCDESGIYVFAQPHPKFRTDSDAFLDTVQAMVQRDKNHPSIITWSLGQVEPSSTHHTYAANWIRTSGFEHPLFATSDEPVPWNDFVAPSQLGPGDFDNLIRNSDIARPIILQNFAQLTGNSNEVLSAFGMAFGKHPQAQGGFIASWADQAIARDTLAFVSDKTVPARQAIIAGAIERVDDSLALTRDFATIPPDPFVSANSADFEIEVRVKPELGSGTWLSKGTEQFWIGQTSAGAVRFRSGPDTVVEVSVSDDWFGKWHTVTGVSTEGSVAIEIDGEEVATAPRIDQPRPSGVATYIGLDPQTDERFSGSIARATLRQGESQGFDITFEEATELETPWMEYGDAATRSGIVTADRERKPTYWNVKKFYTPVRVEALDIAAGKVRIENRYQFLNLDTLETHWSFEENGTTLESGMLATPPIAPGLRQEMWIPFTTPRPRADAVYTLTLRFRLAENTPWADAGHEVHAAQFEVPLRTPPSAPSGPWPRLRVKESDDEIHVSSANFSVVFDTDLGMILNWTHDDRDVVAVGPTPNIWRAPTDADRASPLYAAWKTAGLNDLRWNLQSIEAHTLDENRVDIHVSQQAQLTAATITSDLTYRIYGDGRILLQHTLTPDGELPDLPKVGLQMILPPEYWKLEWFGLGPFEVYPFRHGGAILGRYTEDAALTPMPYATPQDYGNKTQVHWAALLDDEGYGLALKFESPGNVSAHPYATYQLEEARHAFALIPSNTMTLNTDFLIAGSDYTHPITPQSYTHHLWLRPISSLDDVAKW